MLLFGLQKFSSTIYTRLTGAYSLSMSKQEYTWASPDKHIPIGTLVRFISAPPRYENEESRSPGPNLEGKLALVIDWCGGDSHQWGGVFKVHVGHTGEQFMHWGDFMEVVE